MNLVSHDRFHAVFERSVHRFDDEKRGVVDEGANATVHVVAGPGTGKTTTLVARVIKMVFVDGVPPGGIVATTFTKKAANELRSRILEHGYAVQEALVEAARSDGDDASAVALDEVDINQVWTGTTDSLCQELLTLYRPPGQQPPVLVDEFVTRTMMMRHGVWPDHRWNSTRLKALLAEATGRPPGRFFPSAMGSMLGTVADRFVHDRIDWDLYEAHGPADHAVHRGRLRAALDAYRHGMAERGWIDYAALEEQTLRWLHDGHLAEFLDGLHAVVVDEYQDTNLLQESLYLAMAEGCDGALTVVGDDDQSLYRFRGATVELFTAFPDRALDLCGWHVARHALSVNYRSSKAIIQFVDAYARLDSAYQDARVADKPRLDAGPGAAEGVPILAMLRHSVDELAADMADLVHDLFRGEGYRLPDGEVLRAGAGGDVGDAALLSFSPQAGANHQYLPGKLRDELDARRIGLFNPRGTKLHTLETVRLLGGLLFACLDPDGSITDGVFIFGNGEQKLWEWRAAADEVLDRNAGLRRYVRSWQRRHESRRWPSEIPMVDLVYDLAHHVPGLMNDPEGQLHLEAILRQLSAAERIASYGGRIVTDDTRTDRGGSTLTQGSVKQAIENVLVPLVDGTVALNEELVEDFPHDRLPVLSIHQSKGLEFPLVFADVGSRIASPRSPPWQRFPTAGEESHTMEDHFRVGSPLGVPTRAPVDRAFDDLYRRFFVAYSRARDVLILLGRRGVHPDADIRHVAMGWTRDGTSTWSGHAIPFVEI